MSQVSKDEQQQKETDVQTVDAVKEEPGSAEGDVKKSCKISH